MLSRGIYENYNVIQLVRFSVTALYRLQRSSWCLGQIMTFARD